jgi:hypothetical protein
MTCPDLDVRTLLNTASGHGFKQRTRHKESVEAEIPAWEGIEAGTFQSYALTGSCPHRACVLKIALEVGKQRLQRLQAACEESVGVWGLRRPAAGGGLRGEKIAL